MQKRGEIIEAKICAISNLNKIMLLFNAHKYKYFDLNSFFGFYGFEEQKKITITLL